MKYKRIQLVDQGFTTLTVLREKKIPRSASQRVQAVNPIWCEETLSPNSKRQPHLPAKDLEEGNSVTIGKSAQSRASNSNSTPLGYTRNSF